MPAHGELRLTNSRGYLAVVWWATFLYWIGIHIHALVMPIYLESLGLQELTIGTLVGALSLAAVIGRISTGWLLDQTGTITLLLAGSILWAVATPPLALSTTLVPLYLLTVVQGWGVGSFNNAALSAVTTLAAPIKRASAISTWETANKLANLFGPLAAAGTMIYFGFFHSFTFSGLTAIGAGALAILLLPAKNVFDRRSLGKRSFSVKHLFVDAIWRQSLIGGVVGVAVGGFTTFAPILALRVGLGNPGIYVASYAAAIVLSQLLYGRVADRVQRQWVLLPALLVASVGSVILPFITSPKIALIVPIIFGVGVGVLIPSLIAWVVDSVEANSRANASSTLFTLYELGRFIGAVGIGFLIQTVGLLGFLVNALLLLLTAVFYFSAFLANQNRLGATTATSDGSG